MITADQFATAWAIGMMLAVAFFLIGGIALWIYRKFY